MQVKPLKPVNITIQVGLDNFECQLISLTDNILELNCLHYLERDTNVYFLDNFFHGNATVEQIRFTTPYYQYKMKVKKIQFHPGSF